MKNIFKETVFTKVKKSKFDLSHDRKFSCKMGQLIPIMCSEVLPGDSFTVNSAQMIRLAPMLAPMMHRVDVYTHFFYVPNRIVWNNWESFISPEDPSNVPVFPTLQGTCNNSSLADYLGVPNLSSSDSAISALPFAAYRKIYNDYYRDQNLIDPVEDTLIDGSNNATMGVDLLEPPFIRAWEHDYYTACLPFAQKGDPVALPLSGTADVVYKYGGHDTWRMGSGTPVNVNLGGTGFNPAMIQSTDSRMQLERQSDSSYQVVDVDNSQSLKVDLGTATSSTINEFRRAIRLQEWLEKNARGGTRYKESLLSHFGVNSDDARLQRPEYLGGGKSPVMISEVQQTSGTDAEPTPLGTLGGHGINTGSTHSFSKFFKEHGYIIGIMSVMPKTSYWQGIPRHFLRKDPLDFPWPSFAHIGEQEVYNEEVNAKHNDPQGIFGYIPRYSECRFIPSTVHGDFRDTLKFWHMSRDLSTTVALNEDFINCVPTDRVFAVQDGTDNLWCHVYNRVSAVRPLPKFGTPTI